MKKKKQPVSKGQQIELNIEGISHDGSGVGRLDGFTVFVPGTAPGDAVTAGVISVQKNHARALPVSVIHPAPSRVIPPCEHYDRCGGCQLQHIDYTEQLRLKETVVRDALKRIGGVNAEVLPVLGMIEPWYYRNKAQVPVGSDGSKVKAGFYEKRSHKIVDMDTCLIQHAANNRAVKTTRLALQELNIPIYDEEKHTGVIRHILTKASFSTDEIVIILVTNGRHLPEKDQLIQIMRTEIEGLTGIVQNINPDRGNVIVGKEDILLWGKPYLTEKLGKYTFRISPQSFFQVNPLQTEVLYDLIAEYAELTGEETVFDLYCGIGTIALYLSQSTKNVVGIESVKSAVEDAQKNAEINMIHNAEFHAGTVEQVMPALIEKGYQPDVVIIDPPRKGCDKTLLDSILQAAPARIIYVSCNPATLARDLKHLTAENYTIQTIQPLDMFPHTSHVETVALLKKK